MDLLLSKQLTATINTNRYNDKFNAGNKSNIMEGCFCSNGTTLFDPVYQTCVPHCGKSMDLLPPTHMWFIQKTAEKSARPELPAQPRLSLLSLHAVQTRTMFQFKKVNYN